MIKTLCAALAAATLTAPAAHAAQPFYLTGALGLGQGNAWISNGAERYESTNHPYTVAIAGGYEITPHFAVEAGHVIFGRYDFANGADLDNSATYLALAGKLELGRNWALTGKVGAARHQIEFSAPDFGEDKFRKTLRMLAIGAQYRFSDNFAGTVALVDYGSSKSGRMQIDIRQFELGLKYNF